MGEVHVPFGDNQSETATLLLAAVEELDDVEPSVVRVDHFTNSFVVPEEVAKRAKAETFDPDADFQAEIEEARKTTELPSQSVTNEEAEVKAMREAAQSPETEQPAKKAAAKKSTAKKAAAKKSAAKKSSARKGN